MRAASERAAARLRALGRPWEVAAFLWLPFLLFTLVAVADASGRHGLGDWEIFRHAARTTLHGHSPYPAADPSVLKHNDQFVYPPVTALLVSPFALLPDVVGRVLVLLLTLGCVPLALRWLGVRDWRCCGIALLTAPALDTVTLGALSSLMLLGVAAAWRYRQRGYLAAFFTAVTAVAKLFVWPLYVWLLATRRLRTALEAAGIAVLLLLGGWAVIGFARLGDYPHLLRVLSRVEATQSYSIVGLLRLSGGSAAVGTALLVVAVVVGVLVAARGACGDRQSLAVAVVGALLATPVLWLHYLVLLFVPMAFARPRLSAVWFLPLAYWATPLAHSNGSIWKACFALVVTGLIVWLTVGPASAAGARRPRPFAARGALPAP